MAKQQGESMRGLSHGEAMIFWGLLCVIVSAVTGVYLLAANYGLGMERWCNPSHQFSPAEQFIRRAGEVFFFLSVIFERVIGGAAYFLFCFGLQTAVNAGLMFWPIRALIRWRFKG